MTTPAQPLRFEQQGERPQAPLAQPAFQQWTFPDGTLWALFHRQGSGYMLRFPGLADFEVSADAFDIQAWPAPGITPATVHHLYLNQVMPLALSRHGKLVLHASAVDLEGDCVAFVGPSGRGKSTLAASFASSGTAFLTDDGLQIEWRHQELMVVPSHPSIRLWEDSQMELIGVTDAIAPPVDYTHKARLLLGAGFAFCEEPRPLRRIYLLGDGSAPSISFRAVPPAAALMGLIRNSFLLDIDAQDMLARHFDDISLIANLPIHYHLDYPRRFDNLPQLRQAIARHVKEGHA